MRVMYTQTQRVWWCRQPPRGPATDRSPEPDVRARQHTPRADAWRIWQARCWRGSPWQRQRGHVPTWSGKAGLPGR